MALMMRTMTGGRVISISWRVGITSTYRKTASQGRRRKTSLRVGEDVKGEVREAPDLRIYTPRMQSPWDIVRSLCTTTQANKLTVLIAYAILALLFPALILLHLLVAPYTKVEESFHVQAVHDILANGLPNGFNDLNLNRTDYDHFSFPGAVPRSALGAMALAMLSKPVILLNEGINRQILGTA